MRNTRKQIDSAFTRIEPFDRLRIRSRFTLIELLVVVAIIAILAALLLPVLSRVKEKARRVVELSDRRQLAIATQFYASDNSGVFPTPYGKETWDHLHVTYYRGGLDLRTALVQEYVTGGEELWDQFMFCQSDLLRARFPYSHSWYGWKQGGSCNAGTLSYYVTPKQGWNFLNWHCDEFDTSRVSTAEPGLPMWGCMLFERRGGGQWFGHDALANVVPYTYPVGSNTMYFDGSGEWVYPRDLVLMAERRVRNEFWWIPNKNGAVTNATTPWPY